MKNLFLTLTLLLGVAYTNYAQTPAATENKTNSELIKWETIVHDFGNVPAGSSAKYEFLFTNLTKEVVEIRNVRASCGCTAPSYTKEPIKNKAKGSVVAVYTAPTTPQSFHKTLTVETSHGTFQLTIKGMVVEANKTPESPLRVNP
jgi:hypothetical protein